MKNEQATANSQIESLLDLSGLEKVFSENSLNVVQPLKKAVTQINDGLKIYINRALMLKLLFVDAQT